MNRPRLTPSCDTLAALTEAFLNELRKILVVDDFEDTRELARIALERVGDFEVRAAIDGDTAVESLQVWKPDLILLDVMLGEESGIDTLRRLRDVDALVRVIFFTARVEREAVDTYLALGVLGVIAKPFEPLLLAERVQKLWERE